MVPKIPSSSTNPIFSDQIFYFLYINYEGLNIVLKGSSVEYTLS